MNLERAINVSSAKMIRLALVYFPSERKNYVVPVKDVINLHRPKSIDDFDPAKTYDINWQVLRRENSDTTEATWSGRIVLLAG